MNTCLLDANSILRYLTNDLPKQAQAVEKRLKQAQEEKIILKIASITIIEVIYHLENWYKLTKYDSCTKMLTFLSPEWILCENKGIVFEALSTYSKTSIDLVDLLLWSQAKNNGEKVMSFDRHFDKLTPKIRVEP